MNPNSHNSGRNWRSCFCQINASKRSFQPSNKILHPPVMSLGPRFSAALMGCGVPSCDCSPLQPPSWSADVNRRVPPPSASITQSGIVRLEHHDHQNSLTRVLAMEAELLSSAQPTSRETSVPFLGRCGVFTVYSAVKVGGAVGP